MTRKHFNAIAGVINAEYRNALTIVDDVTRSATLVSLCAVTHALAYELRAFNGEFDRERFVNACLTS